MGLPQFVIFVFKSSFAYKSTIKNNNASFNVKWVNLRFLSCVIVSRYSSSHNNYKSRNAYIRNFLKFLTIMISLFENTPAAHRLLTFKSQSNQRREIAFIQKSNIKVQLNLLTTGLTSEVTRNIAVTHIRTAVRFRRFLKNGVGSGHLMLWWQ